MYKIGIKVEADDRIGIGHLMRMKTLADELIFLGHHVIFITQSILVSEYLKQDYSIIERAKETSSGDVDSYVTEANWISQQIAILKISLLIVDSYAINDTYLNIIKVHLKLLVVMDDFNRHYQGADVIINGNYYADYGYSNKQIDHTMKKYLVGPQYLILRNEFTRNTDKALSTNIQTYFVSTGGSDPYSMSVKILKALEKYIDQDKAKINMLINSNFPDYQWLIDEANRKNYICVYDNFSTTKRHPDIKSCIVSDLMLEADLGICAGGVTMYELMALGIPVMAFVMADNQAMGVSSLSQNGYVMNLGEHPQLSINFSSALQQMNSLSMREKMVSRGRQLVSGNGAKHIALALEEMLDGY